MGRGADRRLLRDDHLPRVRRPGHSRATAARRPSAPAATSRLPLLAEEVGGGAGTVGGDLFLAIIAAVAFATILAVVAGLVISASGAVAHDVWSNIVRTGHDSEKEEVWVAKIAAVGHRRDRDRASP